MKRFLHLLPLYFLTLVISCESDQNVDPGLEIGTLKLSKEKPEPGSSLNLQYKGDTTSSAVEGIVNYLVADQVYSEDFSLRDSSGIWTASLQIPDSAHALAFVFKAEHEFDTNDQKGFILPLYTKEGEELPGSRAAIGMYYLGSPASYYDLKFPADSALAMVATVLNSHPELHDEFEDDYVGRLMQHQPEKGKEYAASRIPVLASSGDTSEEAMVHLARLYEYVGEQEKSDSLKAALIKKYPSSELARIAFIDKYRAMDNLDDKRALLVAYEKEMGTNNSIYDYLARMLANAYVAADNPGEMQEIASKMSPLAAANLYNSLAWSLAEKAEDLDQAEKYSEKSIDLASNAVLEEPTFLSPAQRQQNALWDLGSFRDTYALIQYKLGRLDEALEAQEKAVAHGGSPDMYDRHLQYLVANKAFKRARKTASEYISQNKGTEKAKEYLKEAFVESAGSSEGYDALLADLEAQAEEQLRQELKNKMINEQAPSFKMKDLEGNEVALASLDGKILILDFWATWCSPCTRSFPGMQKAVDKYADNKQVQFLFVDTFENGPDREKEVEKFIEDNNYSFKVLLDEQIKANEYETASAYGITGIPTKVVIDPQGRVRFKMVGYDGNNDKMVKELGLIIDMLNEEGKS